MNYLKQRPILWMLLASITFLFALAQPEVRAWFESLFSTAVAADEEKVPEAIKALAETLKDKDPDVRKNAALSLGRIGKDARFAVPALIESLKDSEVDVRGASAMALGRIG